MIRAANENNTRNGFLSRGNGIAPLALGHRQSQFPRQPASSKQNGFTILELLTVVAIVAILVAMVFPLFKSAKQNIRKTACIANLHTIASALQQYRLDNSAYPACLLGYYTPNQPMDSCKSASLYPEYVRSIDDFTCPAISSGSVDDPVTVTVPATVSGSYLPPPCRTPQGDTWTLQYYRGDSYSWTDFTGSSGGALITYLLTWANTQDLVGSYTLSDPPPDPEKELRDFGRQLRFKTPDSTTVVTWCANHRTGSDTILVLFLDGSVASLAPDKMNPAAGNVLWRVLP
ncbi:MAG: type II secretion system protein [Armatimonadota bacterium]|nr:type II secretion system protein [Armatimonadota bacterium]